MEFKMGLFRRLLAALTRVERNLKDQGYIVVYGGSTSLLVRIEVRGKHAPGRRRVGTHGWIFAFAEP
jgi:hypothetical protein